MTQAIWEIKNVYCLLLYILILRKSQIICYENESSSYDDFFASLCSSNEE